jgi:hypothetical protein
VAPRINLDIRQRLKGQLHFPTSLPVERSPVPTGQEVREARGNGPLRIATAIWRRQNELRVFCRQKTSASFWTHTERCTQGHRLSYCVLTTHKAASRRKLPIVFGFVLWDSWPVFFQMSSFRNLLSDIQNPVNGEESLYKTVTYLNNLTAVLFKYTLPIAIYSNSISTSRICEENSGFSSSWSKYNSNFSWQHSTE